MALLWQCDPLMRTVRLQTGNITMDSNGDRPGAYNLYNVIDVNGVRQWVISV